MEHKPFAVIAPVAIAAILILGILSEISSTAAAKKNVKMMPCYPNRMTILYAMKIYVGAGVHVSGELGCEETGEGVPGASITFSGTVVPPNLVTTTDQDGFYSVKFAPPTKPGTYTVQAHFAGLKPDPEKWPAGLEPSDTGASFIVK